MRVLLRCLKKFFFSLQQFLKHVRMADRFRMHSRDYDICVLVHSSSVGSLWKMGWQMREGGTDRTPLFTRNFLSFREATPCSDATGLQCSTKAWEIHNRPCPKLPKPQRACWECSKCSPFLRERFPQMPKNMAMTNAPAKCQLF